MSSSPETPGLHFSEIISKNIEYDLYNIARGGMSNGGIIAQLEFALSFNPDLIIYNSTSPDRIEFPTKDNSGISLDASHVSYRYKNSTSSDLKFFNNDNRLISDTLLGIGTWFDDSFITSLYGKDCSDITDKRNAVKHYIEHLYCPQWKLQMDKLLFYAISHKIFSRRIKFIFMADTLGCIPEIEWMGEKNIGYSFEKLVHVRNIHIKEEFGSENFKDPGYHTTHKTQKEIAEYTLEKIRGLGI
jgi:hypothetical protein